MADTYTTASKARLIQDATRTGTWGPVINSDSLELIDDGAIGYQAINIGVATTYAMAAIGNGADSETRAAYWKFSGTPAGAVAVTVPATLATKAKRVDNQTGQKLTIGYSAGTTVVLASGDATLVWFDGSNAVEVGARTGTFTPTIFGAGTAGAPTYTKQIGYYKKQGNLCHIQLYLAISNKGGAAGTMSLAGLPFAAKNTTDLYGGFTAVDFIGFTFASRTQLMTRVSPNTSTIALLQGGSGVSTGVFDAADLSNSTTIILSGQYLTD